MRLDELHSDFTARLPATLRDPAPHYGMDLGAQFTLQDDTVLFPAVTVKVDDYFGLQFPYRSASFTMSVLVDPKAVVDDLLHNVPGMHDLWGPLQSGEAWEKLTAEHCEDIYRGSLSLWLGRFDTWFFSALFWHREPVEDHFHREEKSTVPAPPLFATSLPNLSDAPELVFAEGHLEQYPPQEPDPPGTFGWSMHPPE